MTETTEGLRPIGLDVPRWRRMQEIYHAARELRVTARERFLQYQCVGDAELLASVERLLRSTGKTQILSDAFDESQE